MASTGGTPFLLSPATGHASTPSSSAVLDVEASGAHHRAAKSTPAPDAGAAFVLESKGTVRGACHACLHILDQSISRHVAAAANFAAARTWLARCRRRRP
jgi:hypothetical protein